MKSIYLIHGLFEYNETVIFLDIVCDYGTGCVIQSQTSAPSNFTQDGDKEGRGDRNIQSWASKWALNRAVGSGVVWLRVYVTVKRLSLIHKQQATNRAAILCENHRGVRWGGGGRGAQRAGCLTIATFPLIILIRQLRSQWKPSTWSAWLPGQKSTPGTHAVSLEPHT